MKKLIPDNKNWKDKLSKFFNTKGFYVILAICIIAVAATAIYVTTQNMNSPDTDVNSEKIIPGEANVDKGEAVKPVTGTAGKSETADPKTAVTTPSKSAVTTPSTSGSKAPSKSASTNAPAVTKFSRPVEGAISKDFTRDVQTFSESKTLGDYRAHNGIDFKVDKLTKVRAVAAGTICLVEDNANGVTIEISHSNGVVTKYAGLSKQGLEDISCGLKVKANDTIGLIGDPIQSECEDGPHLHFEVLKNGKSVDPSAYLKSTATTEKKAN